MGGGNGKMNVTKRKNKITVSYELKKNETYRIQEGSKFKSITFLKKPQIVKGISNETEDNKGILFIDYDGVDKRIVEEDYKSISKMFKLPQAYLFQTKENNFHVICLKKFPHSKIYTILKNTRADINYQDMAIRNKFRSYVLRLSNKKGSKKPKFVCMMGENKNLEFEISNAHLNLLEKIYKTPKINYPNIDGGKLVKFHTYETSG